MPATPLAAAVQLTKNTVDEGAPTWSSSGARLAMHRYDGTDFEIAMMNASGARQAFLTADPASDLDPSWLPSGARIVYSSSRSGNNEIYIKNLAGPTPGLTPLTSDPGSDTDPDYNPV
jgi:TolB protein